MRFRPVLPFLLSGAIVLLAGCAGLSSSETSESESAAPARSEATARRAEPDRGPVTATETAVAARASAAASGSGTAGDMAKLVDQLKEAARELATLRTANARLRAERERPAPASAAEPAARVDPAEERLTASLKSYSQFKKDIAGLVAELERIKRTQADAGSDLKSAQDQARQAKAALTRVEDDLRTERRLRQEAEANVTQLREQLRTIARAMADAGLSADKLSASAGGGGRGSSSPSVPSKYVVRSGDTLEKIAERLYGDTRKWRQIYDANRARLTPEGTLEIGMELQIPKH